MEQIEISIKTEAEAAETSPAHCDGEIGVNFIKQEPGLPQSVKSEPFFTYDAVLKEESLVDSSQNGSGQQFVHGASTLASAAGVNETYSSSVGDMLNIEYESADMDIGPTVLQHMDSYFTINKDMSTAAKENTVLVDWNEAMPGGTVKKENIKGEWSDGREQQCVYDVSIPASAGGVNETCSSSVGDVLNVEYESAEMDIGPAVLQHMDSHYTIYKNTGAATQVNTVVVDCNESMPGGRVKKNIEGEWRDDKATSRNCNQTTIEVDYDEAHVYSHPGQQKDLQKHLLHQHRVCENRCSSKADLNLHKPSHSSIELKHHLVNNESQTRRKHNNCDSGEKFAQRGDLTKNMGVHTREKPFQCKICDARFAHSGNLTQHMRVHTGEKPYKCKICDAKFATSSHLTRHMIVHNNEKPYQCKVCDSKFAKSDYLTRHMIVHTGEKPYQCKICDARFARNSGFEQHMRRHTGVKPFQCKICDARFVQKTTLNRHMRVHVGEKRC